MYLGSDLTSPRRFVHPKSPVHPINQALNIKECVCLIMHPGQVSAIQKHKSAESANSADERE